MKLKIWTCDWELMLSLGKRKEWNEWTPVSSCYIIQQDCTEVERSDNFPDWRCCGHWYIFPTNVPLSAIEDFYIITYCKDKLDTIDSMVDSVNEGSLFPIKNVKKYEL